MISHFSARQIIATVVTPDDGATSHLAIALEALFAIGLTSCHACGKNDAF
jgi:Sec-independent protein secretion pathway component TatC